MRTFNAVTEQSGIHIKKLIVKNHKSTGCEINGEDAPIRDLTIGSIKTRNNRLDGVLIAGDIDGVSCDHIDVDGTFLNTSESSTQGAGFRISGTSKSVKNVSVSSLISKNTIKEGVKAVEVENLTIDHLETSDVVGDTVRFEDSNNVKVLGGNIDFSTSTGVFRGILADTVDGLTVDSMQIKGDLGSGSDQDGLVAVDTQDTTFTNNKVITNDQAGRWTGTSDHAVITGNNVYECVTADKFDTSILTNFVEANNLET